MLLISEYGIDVMPYNKESEDVTWETCTLRKWLNNDFYSSAFSEEEQKLIEKTKVKADKNPKYKTDPGADTEDRIFLLSISEAEKYFEDEVDIKCVPTGLAVRHGANAYFVYSKGTRFTCDWWLRSPSGSHDYASLIGSDGSLDYRGTIVDRDYVCIRPALKISNPESITGIDEPERTGDTICQRKYDDNDGSNAEKRSCYS